MQLVPVCREWMVAVSLWGESWFFGLRLPSRDNLYFWKLLRRLEIRRVNAMSSREAAWFRALEKQDAVSKVTSRLFLYFLNEIYIYNFPAFIKKNRSHLLFFSSHYSLFTYKAVETVELKQEFAAPTRQLRRVISWLYKHTITEKWEEEGRNT